MKKYSKPSIKFAAFKNSSKTSAVTRDASALGIGGTKMDPLSFKVRPLDPKTN